MRQRGIWEAAFWNVVRMSNKNRDFWIGLREWDVITLTEMWVDGKRWKKVREKLSEGYEWGVQYAKKKNRMRRAKRGNNNGD